MQPNVCIIGHTQGIGKELTKFFKNKKFKCLGLSRSNGYDLNKNIDKIILKVKNYNCIILNAYSNNKQKILLNKIVKLYKKTNKKIFVITSTSGINNYFDTQIKNKKYMEYHKHKKELISCIEKLQQKLFNYPLSIFDICPDIVDTNMSKDFWKDLPRLLPHDIATVIFYILKMSNKFNINKLVIQKK